MQYTLHALQLVHVFHFGVCHLVCASSTCFAPKAFLQCTSMLQFCLCFLSCMLSVARQLTLHAAYDHTVNVKFWLHGMKPASTVEAEYDIYSMWACACPYIYCSFLTVPAYLRNVKRPLIHHESRRYCCDGLWEPDLHKTWPSKCA